MVSTLESLTSYYSCVLYIVVIPPNISSCSLECYDATNPVHGCRFHYEAVNRSSYAKLRSTETRRGLHRFDIEAWRLLGQVDKLASLPRPASLRVVAHIGGSTVLLNNRSPSPQRCSHPQYLRQTGCGTLFLALSVADGVALHFCSRPFLGRAAVLGVFTNTSTKV